MPIETDTTLKGCCDRLLNVVDGAGSIRPSLYQVADRSIKAMLGTLLQLSPQSSLIQCSATQKNFAAATVGSCCVEGSFLPRAFGALRSFQRTTRGCH